MADRRGIRRAFSGEQDENERPTNRRRLGHLLNAIEMRAIEGRDAVPAFSVASRVGIRTRDQYGFSLVTENTTGYNVTHRQFTFANIAEHTRALQMTTVNELGQAVSHLYQPMLFSIETRAREIAALYAGPNVRLTFSVRFLYLRAGGGGAPLPGERALHTSGFSILGVNGDRSGFALPRAGAGTDIVALMRRIRDSLEELEQANPEGWEDYDHLDAMSLPLPTWYTISVVVERIARRAGCRMSFDQKVGRMAVTDADYTFRGRKWSRVRTRLLTSVHYKSVDFGERDDVSTSSCFFFAVCAGLGANLDLLDLSSLREECGVGPSEPVEMEEKTAHLICSAIARRCNSSFRLCVWSDTPLVEKTIVRSPDPDDKARRTEVEEYSVETRFENAEMFQVQVAGPPFARECGDVVILYHSGSAHCSLLTKERVDPEHGFCPHSGIELGWPLKKGNRDFKKPSRFEQLAAIYELTKAQDPTAECEWMLNVQRDVRRCTEARPADFVVHMDFETCFTAECVIQPYSVSLRIERVDNDLTGQHTCVFDRVITLLEVYPHTGEALLSELFDVLFKHTDGARKVSIVTFNGSRFDFFPLLDFLTHRREVRQQYSVFNVRPFWAGHRLLRLEFMRYDARNRRSCLFITCDLCRFVQSSLADACRDFRTEVQKVAGFDHSVPQTAAIRHRLLDWILENKERLVEYNRVDTHAQSCLFWAVRRAVDEIMDSVAGGHKRVNPPIEHFLTISALAFNCWQRLYKARMKRTGVDEQTAGCLAPSDHDVCQRVRAAMYGGRAEVNRGVVEDRTQIMDVTSLYPWVMKTFDMPVGEEKFTWQERKDCLGIYRCIIREQRADRFNVVPKRSRDAADPLDWKWKRRIPTVTEEAAGESLWLCTVDIEELRRVSGPDSVQVCEGYYWENKSPHVFVDYVEKLESGKNEQDALKEQKSPEYNPALRAMYKMLLNSLSGKVSQRNFREECEYFKGVSEWDRKYLAHQHRYDRVRVDCVGEDKDGLEYVLVTARKSEAGMRELYSRKRTKPAQLSVFIYAYARRHLLAMMELCPSVFATDTDSVMVRYSDYERVLAERPELFVTGFGGWTIEMADFYKKQGIPYDPSRSKQRFYVYAPKSYCVQDIESEKPLKVRFKGVSACDRLLTVDAAMRVKVLECIADERKQENVSAHAMFAIYQQLSPALGVPLYHRLLVEKCPAVVLSSQIQKLRYCNARQACLLQSFLIKIYTPPDCSEEMREGASDYVQALLYSPENMQ